MSQIDDELYRCHLKRCENCLEISGCAQELERFKTLLATPASVFDFNAILPYPDAYKKLDKEHDQWTALSEAERKTATMPDTSSGANWRMVHWGTPWVWNAQLATSNGALCYTFITGYTPPIALLLKVSTAFPKLQFFLFCELIEHDLTGEYVIQSGRVSSEEWMPMESDCQVDSGE